MYRKTQRLYDTSDILVERTEPMIYGCVLETQKQGYDMEKMHFGQVSFKAWRCEKDSTNELIFFKMIYGGNTVAHTLMERSWKLVRIARRVPEEASTKPERAGVSTDIVLEPPSKEYKARDTICIAPDPDFWPRVLLSTKIGTYTPPSNPPEYSLAKFVAIEYAVELASPNCRLHSRNRYYFMALVCALLTDPEIIGGEFVPEKKFKMNKYAAFQIDDEDIEEFENDVKMVKEVFREIWKKISERVSWKPPTRLIFSQH